MSRSSFPVHYLRTYVNVIDIVVVIRSDNTPYVDQSKALYCAAVLSFSFYRPLISQTAERIPAKSISEFGYSVLFENGT